MADATRRGRACAQEAGQLQGVTQRAKVTELEDLQVTAGQQGKQGRALGLQVTAWNQGKQVTTGKQGKQVAARKQSKQGKQGSRVSR